MVRKVWKMASTMARPTAASAAASTMTKRAKTWPPSPPLTRAVEGDEVDVGAVEDELDAHQHAHRVAAGDHRDEAEREEQRADDEEVLESDVSMGSPVRASAAGRVSRASSSFSLRAMTTAPTSVASSTTEASSKGSS